jgi:hypothetical protein
MDYKELFTSTNIIIFFIVVILLIAVFYYWRSRKGLERFTNDSSHSSAGGSNVYPTAASGDSPFKTQETANVDKVDVGSSMPNRTPTNPGDLLPSSTGANWGNLYPVQNEDPGVYVPSLISPDFSIGVNTISGTTRLASLDLRAQPLIEKKVISPWNNSSVQADIAHVGIDGVPSTY